MSTITVSYPVTRRPLSTPQLFCPKCHAQMKVYALWKERNKQKPRYEGVGCHCVNNCLDNRTSPAQVLTFYCWDIDDLKKAVNDLEKAKIFADTEKYCKSLNQ